MLRPLYFSTLVVTLTVALIDPFKRNPILIIKAVKLTPPTELAKPRLPLVQESLGLELGAGILSGA